MESTRLDNQVIIANRYEVLELISSRNFSCVYKVLDKQDSTFYALKKMNYTKATYLVENEVSILKKLSSNENFLNFYGEVKDKEDLYLKFEFLQGKTLEEIIEEEGVFTEKRAIELLSDICKQLMVSKNNNIIHNDIKPQNIMYCNEKFYLTGWDTSSFGEIENYDKDLRNEMFLSPEHYNAKVLFNSDIYALGHIVYYSLHGYLLYNKFSQISNIEVMLFHFTKKVEYKDSLSLLIKKILENMLCKENEIRINIQTLYDSLFKNKEFLGSGSKGLGLPKYKLDTDVKILKYLSSHNILTAKFLYAIYLEDSLNYKEAVLLYFDLAKQGYTEAMNNLGYLYEANEGIKQDYKLSAYWYFKAGKLGNTMAIYNMGKFFEYGKGVEKDIKKAESLFQLAIKKGYIK